MEYQTSSAQTRIHPLMAGAAASVILVSLLGIAALAGLMPAAHSFNAPNGAVAAETLPVTAKIVSPVPLALVAPARYVTPDGQVLEAVPNTQMLSSVGTGAALPAQHLYQATPAAYRQAGKSPDSYARAPLVHHNPVQHYAQNTYSRRDRSYQRSYYSQQTQHPVRSYVSDMHPIGTGVGAVVGGLLGNQVGGGNGKKLATVAGVLLGGYAGNEVAHNRSPLPW
jgi:uncharacterized protein YcfJ